MAYTIKNHVSKKAKRISGILQGKYGLNLATLDKALKGDKEAQQLIGEAGRQGQLTQELMPMLAECYQAAIKGTEEYNKGISAILKQGASSAIAIDKASSQAMLANQKYGNQRTETAAEFAAAKSSETTRHQYALNYIQLKAYIDQYITKIDNDSKLAGQANRPELKQIDENARDEVVAAKHLLQYGENANLELLPRREYATVSEGDKSFSFKEKLGQLASSLGF
jgi:hypothetical protein